jgi:hypothetical protein
MADIDSCDHCIYFGINPQYEIGPGLNWCYRHNIISILSSPKCPKYKNHTEFEGDFNPQYLGFIEREKDRKREHRINLLLSGLVGIVGIVIGVFLGKYL